MNNIFILIIVALLSTGCAGVKPGLRMIGTSDGGMVAAPSVTVPWGATATSSTETTQSASLTPAELRSQRNTYQTAWQLAIEDENPEGADILMDAITDINMALVHAGHPINAPLIENEAGAVSDSKQAIVTDDNLGFWMGLLADYRNGVETLKTTAMQIVTAYLVAAIAHEAGLVDIGGLAFWENNGETDAQALARASQTLADSRADKNIIRGNNNALSGAPQSSNITIVGNGNSVEFQEDDTVEFFSVPAFETDEPSDLR